ncbi:MAG: SWIM zinc finger family protein [Deltaproteobacteria bacterium]|jgi:uncharacterized Zn finger protein/DNA-binding XRE family transcriptional regulator|nr:SWIM zinc finger family protein [Deltaproteobacteria bacterium]
MPRLRYFNRPSASQKRATVRKSTARFQKTIPVFNPISIQRRHIASTFWGERWCEHFEAMADFENRLPRGRTYARNGSIIHLELGPGRIYALVAGSDVYEVNINIKPLDPLRWEEIKLQCHGKISNMVALFKGQFSKEVLEVVCDCDKGLFPRQDEITYNCSCPDWANLCKHVAAVFYGIGNRLDTDPELIFTLRQVDPLELLTIKAEELTRACRDGDYEILDESRLGEIFGIVIHTDALPQAGPGVSGLPGGPSGLGAPSQNPAPGAAVPPEGLAAPGAREPGSADRARPASPAFPQDPAEPACSQASLPAAWPAKPSEPAFRERGSLEPRGKHDLHAPHDPLASQEDARDRREAAQAASGLPKGRRRGRRGADPDYSGGAAGLGAHDPAEGPADLSGPGAAAAGSRAHLQEGNQAPQPSGARPGRKRAGAVVKARRDIGRRGRKAPIVTYVKKSAGQVPEISSGSPAGPGRPAASSGGAAASAGSDPEDAPRKAWRAAARGGRSEEALKAAAATGAPGGPTAADGRGGPGKGAGGSGPALPKRPLRPGRPSSVKAAQAAGGSEASGRRADDGAGREPSGKIAWNYQTPVNFDQITGRDVRRIRKLSGLSQLDLSRILGVGMTTYLRWESEPGVLNLRNSSLNALKAYFQHSFAV